MLTYLLGAALFLTCAPSFFVLGVLVLHLCKCGVSRFFNGFPKEVDMPEKPPRPTTRFVCTLPGDSLADGIRRAYILSAEYDEVFLVHDHTPVRVTFDSTPYSVEKEWQGTRKLQLALAHCEGK